MPRKDTWVQVGDGDGQRLKAGEEAEAPCPKTCWIRQKGRGGGSAGAGWRGVAGRHMEEMQSRPPRAWRTVRRERRAGASRAPAATKKGARAGGVGDGYKEGLREPRQAEIGHRGENERDEMRKMEGTGCGAVVAPQGRCGVSGAGGRGRVGDGWGTAQWLI